MKNNFRKVRVLWAISPFGEPYIITILNSAKSAQQHKKYLQKRVPDTKFYVTCKRLYDTDSELYIKKEK